MAKTRLVKNSKGQYGIYDPYTDKVTPITSNTTLVKSTRGKYGFKNGDDVIELDVMPTKVNLEETFKKKVDTVSSSATSSTDSTSDFYKPVGIEEKPKPTAKELADIEQKKKEENQRFIDFGFAQLDYSGLQQYGAGGEFAADILDVPANISKAFVRGTSNGRINQEISNYARRGGDLDSDMIARLIKENSVKGGSNYLKSLQQKGILQTEDMSAIGGIAEVIFESLGSMLSTTEASFEGAVLGGSAGLAYGTTVGATGGSVAGPAGTVVGGVGVGLAAAGTGALIGAQGMSSYVNEYGSTIIDTLTKNGYDLTDAKQVEAGLKNKAVMESAKEEANKRGLIIGGFDALTAGIAGKAAKVAVKVASYSAAQAGKQLSKVGVAKIVGRTALGIEMVGGSTGEALAQLATKGKITDYDAVALEGIAEIGSSAPSTVYAAYKSGQINSDLNQKNLQKIEDLKRTKEALPEDSKSSKDALDNKISALEKENKERNKSMTAALQVAPVPATQRVIELTDAIQEIESTLEDLKDGTRTDITPEGRAALFDSMNDMLAERDEIRQEMLKASDNEAKANMAPTKPMKPVIFIGENKEKVDNNNATTMSPNRPLETVKVEEPITFAEKISDEKNAKPGVAYNVSQGDNVFGTIVESDNNGEKQFILAETGKKYASLDDAKFALQEKLTGQRVSEKERTGIDRVKVEGNLANQKVLIGDPANNNELGLESKSAIQRAVRAMRSVSNANVYLYSNTAEYEKGIAHASKGDEKAVTKGTNAQVVDANGENSIHINLEMADGTTISHEVFHGALLGLAKKDPNAFITMRDKILDRISEKQSLSVTDATGTKRKVSAKEYLMDFQKRYEGPQYTEADRAEEFLSELAGLMSLEDSTVVSDKSLLDSIKLTIKDVLKKFNVEFDSLNELQETEDLVQFFKDFNRSVKTGEAINLGNVEGIKGTAAQPTAQAAAATQPTAQVISANTVTEAQPVEQPKEGDITTEASWIVLGRENKEVAITDIFKGKEKYLEGKWKSRYRHSYAKTVMDKNGNIYTGFYEKIDDMPVTSNRSFFFDNRDVVLKSGNTEAEIKGRKNFIENFEEGYGISAEDALAQQGIKLRPGEQVASIMISGERFEMQNGKPVRVAEAKFNVGKKGQSVTGPTKRFEINIGVPKLMFTDESKIDASGGAQPTAQAATATKTLPDKYDFTPKSKYKFTIDENGNQESEFVPMFTIKNEINGINQNVRKSEDVTYYAKTEHRASLDGAVSTSFYRGPKEPENGGSFLVRYRTNESIAENRSRLSYDGGKMSTDFESDYGISIEQALANSGMKLKANQEVYEFQVSSEVYMPTDYKGESIPPRKVYLRDVRIKNKETGKITYKDEIDLVVPKLKYTDEIAGLPAAEPEAGAAKKSITTRLEGAQKKESAAKVISSATDKAKPSVKVAAKPKKGKRTVGNTKKISERVAKVTGEVYQASLIEPTNAREMALQYFIRGGTVLRGNTANGAKPKPHTLVTLFTRSRPGMYYSDKAEMEARLQLYRNGTLTMSEVAHKLWESAENQNLQLDSQELQNALESVIMDHKSSAGMAKEMLETRGTPSQKALISGDTTFAGMDDYEIMTWQHAAEELGVSVEELVANPDKYIKPEVLDGMYDDMLSAFEILDQIQDEESIKQYLEISKPEDLFLDELVAAAAKPEKTLEAQKKDIEDRLKAKKKELAAANKKKNDLLKSASGQISLIEGTQTRLVPPITVDAYKAVSALTSEIEDIKYRLGQVNSAIAFKERKTIDAFADVVEQKAEEAKPAGTPLAEMPESQQDNLLKDNDGNPHTFFVIGKTMDGKAFELSTVSTFDRNPVNKELGFGTATVSLKDFKRLNYASILFNDINTDKLASLIKEAKESGSEGIIAIDGNGNIKTAYVFDKSNIHEADIQVSETDKQESGISEDDSVEYMQKKLYEATRDLENAKNEKAEAQIQKNIETIERAIEAKKLSNMVRIGDDMFSNEQIRMADSKQTNEQLEARQEAIQEEYDAIEEEYQISDSVLSNIDPKNKVPFQSASIKVAKLASQKFALINEAENIAAALRLREYRAKAEAAPAPQNNDTSGNEARLAMSKEIDNQLAEKENQLIEKQNNDIKKAKDDVIAIKSGDKSVVDEYVRKSGYKLITKEVVANNPNSQILAKNEGSYYKNLGYQIRVGTAQQIALQGATNKANSKPKGISVGKNQYQDAYNAIVKLSKGEITANEAKDVIEASGLTAPEAITAKAEPAKAEAAPAETSKVDKEIKSLQDEIEQYEREIEDATEEIENTKSNYKESVAAFKDAKDVIRGQKMSKEYKQDMLDEIDSEIEDAADERDTYIEQYKETIADAKREIKSLQKQIDKLSVKTKAQISGERVAPFLKADPTYKYQMSGTEASLKLIDNIRSKYKMQNTAEEMGMVSKGMRATEKIISDNVVTRVFGGASAAVYKRFANDRANKLIGKPLAMLQSLISNSVRKGLSSQNAAAANASAIAVGLIQNLGSTEAFQFARNKLVGGKSVAKNELWQLGKNLNEIINEDKVALRRVHSLLDPEAFEGITDPTLPDSKADLSFAELRLFNILRDMNDYIHEWHYQNGFLGEGPAAEALYEKNKGSYFARMYNEIETEKFGDLYDALAKLPNAADFTMFKERKDFLDVTENLTLKEDPIYITTKRFGQMMQNQAILQFCDYVAKSGDYKVYKNKEDIPAESVSNYRQLMPKKGGGKVYGELTGKFVPDIVAQQLVGIEFSNQVVNLTYQAAKVFDKSFARQVLSKLKTTWNPLTRAGNITMNFVFAALAGVDPVTLLKNRPSAKESLDSYDSYARDLDANGLLGVSMGKELNNEKDAKAEQAVRDAANKMLGRKPGKKAVEETPAEPKSKMAILGSGIKKVVGDLDQMLTDSYGKSDDVAKVALYKSLVDDYGKTREEAIKIVAGSMQNYNTVGKAYDYASKSVNRFVKFKADSARILFNTFKDRPLNLMATLGMFLAAQALASKISGEDEEERKIREDRPYTNKIKIGPVTISLTMMFGDTEINVARYLAPYSMYDAGYDSNKFEEMSAYLPVQYDEDAFIVVNDPLIGPLVNLARDKDFRGMTISDPGKSAYIEKTVTDEEAIWNRVAFAGRNYGAPYYGWAENAVAAASGDADYYGRTRTMSEAMLNTVIKVQTVNNETLQRTYEGSVRRLDSEISNIEKTISAKSNKVYEDIDKKASQEGVTAERLDKYIADKERELLNFTNEQMENIDKKVLEQEKVQGTLGRLYEINQRKKQ